MPDGAEPERFAERRAFLLGHVSAGDRVLDLGCGDGAFAAALVQAGADVTAVDVAAEAVRRARDRAPGARVEQVAEGAALPLDEDAFDLVWAGETLEHVADVVGLLAEVRRVLRWGGMLLVTTPNLPRLGVALEALRGRAARAAARSARRPPALLHRANARGGAARRGLRRRRDARARRAARRAPRAHRGRPLAVALRLRGALLRGPLLRHALLPRGARAGASPRGRSPAPAPSAGRGRARAAPCRAPRPRRPRAARTARGGSTVSGVAGCSCTARSQRGLGRGRLPGGGLDLAQREQRVDRQRVEVARPAGRACAPAARCPRRARRAPDRRGRRRPAAARSTMRPSRRSPARRRRR